MKIVIAPDSYKGSLSALEVGKAIRSGIQRVDESIETVIVPMADGGEGTVQSMVDATTGHIVNKIVHDPLFREIKSFYGILGDQKTAIIEMAAASGLPLLKEDEKDPLKTTSFGTGELIKDAVEKGCTKIIIGIGGSATNDGGTGMARALGVRFLDETGNEIGFGGGELSRIHEVDVSGIDPAIKNVEFIAASDVDNPLCGPEGASRVYGPQKGANESDLDILDKGLAHFARIVENELGLDLMNFQGAGAAGGLGYAVMVFLNAKLENGIDIVCEVTRLEEKMEGADLVITGEGQIDSQTQYGKTPYGVSKIAKKTNIPVVALAGSLGHDYQKLYDKGFDAIFSIIDSPMKLDEAIDKTEELLINSSEAVVRLWISSQVKINNGN